MRALHAAGLVIATQLGDLASSLYGLAHGAHELNPLIHSAGDLVSSKAVAIVLTCYVLALASVFAEQHPRIREAVILAAVFASGATLAATMGNLGI